MARQERRRTTRDDVSARASGQRRATDNLPAEVSSFIGRREELVATRRLLSQARLVTLTGPGGIGKSRLAVQVARDVRRAFPDGVWLVELSELQEPRLLPHTVLAALGIRDDTPRDVEDVLVDHLADRQLLLVLDNCEHLVEACTMLATTVLSHAPRARILATSREPLLAPGEMVCPVPPLSLPEPTSPDDPGDTTADVYSRYEALALFEQRAAAVQPGFEVTATNGAQVAALCRQLDGIPLAIELAAARVSVLSVEEILARLDHRFQLLVGSAAAPARRRSLQAMVEGTYDLCSKPERLLWTRAAIFPGGFDLDAAESVCAGDGLPVGEVLQALSGLIDKSVLIREEHDDEAWFRMLDTLRQYGRERLAESGEEPELRRRHRDHYLGLAEQAEEDWFGRRQQRWLARLSRDWPNLRAALEQCHLDPEGGRAGLRMVGALWPAWIGGGYLREGRHWLDRVLADSGPEVPERPRALWVCALVMALQGDTEPAQGLMRECQTLLGQDGDAGARATAARVSGLVEMLAGHHEDARTWLERSVQELLSGASPDALGVLAFADLAVVHALGGDVPRGLQLCEQGRAICASRGETWALSWILSVHNFVRIVDDEAADAFDDLHEMLWIKDSFNDVLGVLQASEMLAWVTAAHGDAGRAATLMGAAVALWKPLGAFLLGFQPYLDRHQECLARARSALGDAGLEERLQAGARLDLKGLVAYALSEAAATEDAPLEDGRRPMAELTSREWEVAELIAEGLADREIAERLVISHRTAGTHVANILTKLGFRSRVQVARWAVERRSRPGGGE